MNPRLSRRALLGSVGSLGVGLAGCTGSGPEGPVRNCTTAAVTGGATDGAIAEARVAAGELATLVVSVNPGAAGSMDHLSVTGSTEDYRIPVLAESPRERYEQSLGPLPHNGRLRVEARTAEGEVLDAIVVEFRCREEPTEEG